MEEDMSLRFYGVRGSIASPSIATTNFMTDSYGGNTTCIEVKAGKENYIVDGGTGLRGLGNAYMKREFGKGEGKADIFFTHVHWDHIQGIPFFVPFFIKGNKFGLYGAKKVNNSLESCLRNQQQYPNFPLTLEDMRKIGADLRFYDLSIGTTNLGNGTKISYIDLFHPDGVFSYKFEKNGKKIVIATDNEHDSSFFSDSTKFGPNDERLIHWSDKADILVYDGQYTPEEYEGVVGGSKKGWGHSTYEKGVDISVEAGVKNLIITHHDPSHDDRKLDEIAERLCNYAKGKVNAILAHEGLDVHI
jgi:phosphoribosyl 1,2-cyclic phosphodiesterase